MLFGTSSQGVTEKAVAEAVADMREQMEQATILFQQQKLPP